MATKKITIPFPVVKGIKDLADLTGQDLVGVPRGIEIRESRDIYRHPDGMSAHYSEYRLVVDTWRPGLTTRLFISVYLLANGGREYYLVGARLRFSRGEGYRTEPEDLLSGKLKIPGAKICEYSEKVEAWVLNVVLPFGPWMRRLPTELVELSKEPWRPSK